MKDVDSGNEAEGSAKKFKNEIKKIMNIPIYTHYSFFLISSISEE
jgi:hypothetical protein